MTGFDSIRKIPRLYDRITWIQSIKVEWKEVTNGTKEGGANLIKSQQSASTHIVDVVDVVGRVEITTDESTF